MVEEEEKKGKKPSGLLDKLVPILLVASVGLAFVVGILWQKVSSLEKGGEGSGVAGAVNPSPANLPQGPTQGKLAEDQAKKIPPITDDDHIKGSKDAQVFLIEYSDYQCPFCSRFHPTAQQVLAEYGDKIAWVYRHFPLDQLHPKARPAAEASECVASLAGNEAFWDFTDKIFEDIETSVDRLAEIAQEVGVDKVAFETCVDNGDFSALVDGQQQGGVAAGVTGTPGNIIVNRKGEAWLIPGAVPFEQIKSTIDEALSS